MRVLVVYFRNKTTFIQRDIDIFRKHYEVDEISIRKLSDAIPLFRKIRRSDIVYVWFSGKHAGVSVLLSRLLRKRSIVVVGGYDVVSVPEIEYGLWYNGKFLDKLLCKYAIKSADVVLPVSETHKGKMLDIANPRKYVVVYNGVPSDFCSNMPEEKKKTILSVSVLKKENIKRKGLKTILKIAPEFAEYQFIIAGKPLDDTLEYLRKIAPDNVEILGFLPEEELASAYSKAEIYLQLSAYESFGIAVVEAMQCGCIPVVTNRGALPEVVGNAGIVVEYGNLESIKRGIKKAIEWSRDEERRKNAIERARVFSLEERERKLISIVEGLVK